MHQHLSRMTLREKLAQRVVIDFRFDDADYDRTMRLVKKEGVGGIRVFGGSVFELPSLVNSFQKVAKFPLLIAANYSEGAGWEVSGATCFPWTDSEELAGLKARFTASEARALGVRWLPLPGLWPPSGQRIAPEILLAKAYLQSYRAVGALSWARSAGVPAEPESREFMSTVDAVVVDPGFSAEKVGELRSDLEFEGLLCVDLPPVFSDRESVERAVRIGADMIMAVGDPDLALQVLEDGAKSGQMAEAAIDRSVARILAAKDKLGLFSNRMTDVTNVETAVGGMMSRATGQKIAEAEGVTLVRGRGRIAERAAFLKIIDPTEKGDLRVLESELAKRTTLTETAEQCIIAIDSAGLKNGFLDEGDIARIREAEKRYKEVIVVNLGYRSEFFKESDSFGFVQVSSRDPFTQKLVAKAFAGEHPYRIAPENYFQLGKEY